MLLLDFIAHDALLLVLIFWMQPLGASGPCTFRTGQFEFVSQFCKQRAVMNHGLSHVFRTCAAFGMLQRNVVSRAIVFDNERMIDGNIRGSLIEVRHGITAPTHYF